MVDKRQEALRKQAREACRDGEHMRAMELYKKAAAGSTKDGRLLHETGTECEHTEDYSEAAKYYEQASAALPDWAVPHFRRGVLLYLRFQNPAGARVALEKCISLDRSSHEGWNNLAYVLIQLGEITKAEEALRRALDLASRHVIAYANLGVVLCLCKRYKDAEEAFNVTLRLATPEDQAMCLNILAFDQDGNTTIAELRELGRYGGINIEATARYNLAFLLAVTGNLGDAKRDLDELIGRFEPPTSRIRFVVPGGWGQVSGAALLLRSRVRMLRREFPGALEDMAGLLRITQAGMEGGNTVPEFVRAAAEGAKLSTKELWGR